MAFKKKTKRAFFIILGIIIFILILNWFGLFNFREFSVGGGIPVPIKDFCLNPECEVDYPFTCPDYYNEEIVKKCKVQGILDCQSTTENIRVVFRTNIENNVFNKGYCSNRVSNSITFCSCSDHCINNCLGKPKINCDYGLGDKCGSPCSSPWYFSNWIALDIGTGNLNSFTFSNISIYPLDAIKDSDRTRVINHIDSNIAGNFFDLYLKDGDLLVGSGEIVSNVFPSVEHKFCACSQIWNNRCEQSSGCLRCVTQLNNPYPESWADCGPSYYEDGRKFYRFITSTNADTSSQSKEEYLKKGQEIIRGNLYNCNAIFRYYKKDGSSFSEPLNYPQSSPWSMNSTLLTMDPGETATFENIGNKAMVYLYAGINKEVTGCSYGGKGVCNDDRTGFYKCKNGSIDYNDIEPCIVDAGDSCQLGECVPPLDKKDIILSKKTYTPGEQIFIDYQLLAKPNTPLYKINQLEFKIYKEGDNDIKRNWIKDINFRTPGTLRAIIDGFDASMIGDYYVIAEITYDNDKQPIKLGEELDNLKTYRFSVSNPVYLDLRVDSSLGSKLLIGDIIKIILTPRDSNNQVIDIDSYNLSVKLNGIVQNNPLPESPIVNGVYVFDYIFSEKGILNVRASVSRSGFQSNEKILSNLRIIKNTVTTEVTNKEVLGQMPPTDDVIVRFSTKDSYDNLVESSNIVKITPPGCSVSNCDVIITDVPGSGGVYSFTYDFKTVGGYSLFVLSEVSGFESEYQDIGTITVQEGAVLKDCTLSTECPEGKVCSNYQCVDRDNPYLIYIMFGIIGIVVIIIIFFIFRSIKNRPVETGLEGL